MDVENARIAKCHEVTNLAIEAINVHYGGSDTSRTRLLWSIAMVLDRLFDDDWDCLLKTFGTMISVGNDVCKNTEDFVAFSFKVSASSSSSVFSGVREHLWLKRITRIWMGKKRLGI